MVFHQPDLNGRIEISNLKIEELDPDFDKIRLEKIKEDNFYFLYLLNQNEDFHEFLEDE